MRNQRQLSILGVVSLYVLFNVLAAAAAPRVKLVADYKQAVIVVGAEPRAIILQARPDKQGYTFVWKLNGSGDLQGDEASRGRLYVPPAALRGKTEETVTITVTVTDEQGQTASDSVKYLLQQPTPPSTPLRATPTITPTPTRTPMPVSRCPEGMGEGERNTCVEPITGMVFVWIPGGTFQMGQSDTERDWLTQQGWWNDWFKTEQPRHQVTVSGFWIGQTEVTQAQWQAIMKENPTYFNREKIGQDTGNYPVENISWNMAQEFLEKLNATHPTPSQEGNYRLPSEAEWEYACRAGTTTAYSFGDDPARLGEYAWYTDNSGSQTHPVGQRKPNAWNLYDMHGNVWEWCQDVWHENYQGAPTDGTAWEEGGDANLRLFKSGAWHVSPGVLRCAYRGRYGRVLWITYWGVRLVRGVRRQ